jgi:hypothetical protein
LSIAFLFNEDEKTTPDTFSLSAGAHELPGCSKGSSILTWSLAPTVAPQRNLSRVSLDRSPSELTSTTVDFFIKQKRN